MGQFSFDAEVMINGDSFIYSDIIDADDISSVYDIAQLHFQDKYGTDYSLPSINTCRIQETELVVESDDDTDQSEIDNPNPKGLYPYDPTYTTIDIEDIPFSIYEYLRQMNKGRVIVQPDFQRNQVWTRVQKSRFVESVLLNFPLPPIYLNQNTDGKYIVIDGLQRTTALFDFFHDKYALHGLEALPAYNGLKFSDLSETLQSKLENKKLTVFSLKPSTPMVVIYDLFKRINTGGTQLNRQEIRNCIYSGKSTRLLKELSETECFLKATDYGISPRRMKDREVVLRYLSFKWQDYEQTYEGDMSRYLEDMMVKMNTMDDVFKEKLKADFERVMTWAYKIWGDSAFRIPTEKTRGVINIAVLESVCMFLSHSEDEYLETNIQIIRDRYNQMLLSDSYREVVNRATSSKLNVVKRISLANDFLLGCK